MAQLLKLWIGTLVGNLAGGWIIMALNMTASPSWRRHGGGGVPLRHRPFSAETMALAVLGGMVITLMTRMQHGTDSVPGKIAAAVAGAFLLAGLQLFHSIRLAADLRRAVHR